MVCRGTLVGAPKRGERIEEVVHLTPKASVLQRLVHHIAKGRAPLWDDDSPRRSARVTALRPPLAVSSAQP